MIELSHLGAADWVILVVLALSVLLSLWRGFVREAIALAGWVAAYVVANVYVDEMASVLASTIVNVTGRYVVSFALLFVATLILATIIRKIASGLVKVTGLSLLDRLLGTVFGLARGIIVILVGVYLLRQLIAPQDLIWLDQSQLMPHVDYVAQWAQRLFYGRNQ
ncbi:MAG: CvpA family protein [Halioglobus sp.]